MVEKNKEDIYYDDFFRQIAEKSELLTLMWDYKHNNLPYKKIERMKELKKED